MGFSSVLISVAVSGSQSSGETLKMEMAQAGFSVAYVPGVIMIKDTDTCLCDRKATHRRHILTL